MVYERGTPEIETTTEFEGAPSPWQLHPVSTTRFSPLFHGGPPGIANAGAIKRSAINPKTNNRELRESIVAPNLSTRSRPLNVPFRHAAKGHEQRLGFSTQISFIAVFN